MDFKNLLSFVMSEKCYEKYFYQFDFFDVPCFRAVLSKCLGYVIVLGAVIVKVPQIQKVVAARSAAGISFMALMLEIHAVVSMFTYSLAKGFPFSTWGDSFFLLLQNVILGYLIQHYNGRKGRGVVFVITLVAIISVLTSKFASLALLTALQASNMPAVIISKKESPHGKVESMSREEAREMVDFINKAEEDASILRTLVRSPVKDGKRGSSGQNTHRLGGTTLQTPLSGIRGGSKLVPGPPTLPPVKPTTKKKRCFLCAKRTGLASSYVCRCGNNFCATHRYAESHNCTYDYKTSGRKLLEETNPLVSAPKLPKI